MAEVTYMDPTGLSVLVTEHKRTGAMNGELIILSPSAELRGLFHITALDTYFNIRPQYQLV
jgi:anti-anti-sigma factor